MQRRKLDELLEPRLQRVVDDRRFSQLAAVNDAMRNSLDISRGVCERGDRDAAVVR
jgi:hypothetical protein